jgi:hypothetical protein
VDKLDLCEQETWINWEKVMVPSFFTQKHTEKSSLYEYKQKWLLGLASMWSLASGKQECWFAEPL